MFQVKSLRHFLIPILLLVSILFSEKLFAQNYPSGIYQNVGTSSDSMKFYTINGVNYVIDSYYSYNVDESTIVKKRRTIGMRHSKLYLYFTSGPFAMYGEDGYFFSKNGTDYYYDALNAAYNGVSENNPDDSLKFLYKKVSGLPDSWELKPEERIGELGVINSKLLYEIIRVVDIRKILIKGKTKCIYIKGLKESNADISGEDNFGEYIISEADFLKLKIAKNRSNDLSDLNGMILQLFFKWENGKLPGYLNQEDMASEKNRNCIPYEMIILEESLNPSSNFQFPMPKI